MEALPVRSDRNGPVVAGSFDEFYRSEFHSAARLAFLLCGSDAATEDLVQEAFLRVHGRFDKLDNPSAFLRVVLVNSTRSWHRSQRRHKASLVRVYQRPDVSPEARELMDVLAHLPYRHRATLVLRYWGGFSEAEIASALNVRPGTVKSLASRGLGRLRKELEE